MPVDRSEVRYCLAFVPESGVDPSTYTVIEQPRGIHAAVLAVNDELSAQYASTDWLDPAAGYTEFVEENRRTLARFEQGEISVAAFNVPFGALVIC